MSLQTQITEALKTAMKSKDQIALEALRAIKSELLLVQTSGSDSAISEQDEVKILQKLVKQRKESADVFTAQNRLDLAEPELAQIKVIEQFLPEQMSEEEVEKIIAQIVEEGSFSGMQDMGKVMGLANAKLAGAADGKTISAVVKKLLTT
ncbi:GatB/YqeY domain-containing protein [Avrilella dinanensis]|uniref:Glutamyl-tRNA amidotransferase n=1 Tax=Avrilella dinanensis TaxID=2008672 RepID=A0A2M9R635_9FLAO|nr:GatB/YqeY domain-containing protein [Avrilella dinanensis]PJR04307.1 glutamyl-tRNA amidotransferase [Avrilella dinanensis]